MPSEPSPLPIHHSKIRSFRRATMLGSRRFETFAVLTSWTMASMND